MATQTYQARPKPSAGKTKVNIAGREAPPLPHEQDESSDSSADEPTEVMKQAHADLKRGLVDTDKGPPMDRAYRRQSGDGRKR
jgi:hypothetical protein